VHVSALAARNDGSQKQSERTRTRIPQIAIVGAGFVGSTTAYALLNSGMAAEIVLIDRDRRRAEGHVQDLRDAEVFSNATHVFAASSATAAPPTLRLVDGIECSRPQSWRLSAGSGAEPAQARLLYLSGQRD
jgi:L-lactate dehydrogenase